MGTHENTVAVITGAGSGFGRATAVEPAGRGADIVIVDLRDAAETVAEVEATGRKAVSLTADVADPEQVAAITPEILGSGGCVDILVDNAGVFPFSDV